VDPIRPDASQALIEALASLRADTPRRRRGAAVDGSRQPATLRGQLQAIVAGISSSDEQGVASVRLPVLRCILGAQYGADMSGDPLFAEVLAAVERDLRERPELDAAFRLAIASLASGRSSST
jgi:hypothetical protein